MIFLLCKKEGETRSCQGLKERIARTEKLVKDNSEAGADEASLRHMLLKLQSNVQTTNIK